MRNKLTGETRLPNFLNFFEVGPMAQAVPNAVQIVIPKDAHRGAPAQSGTEQEHR